VDGPSLGFRESRLSVLDFLSRPEAQRDFASKVHYDDYASEFYCWWFEDFHPDSELFRVAFSDAEAAVLERFAAQWRAADARLGDEPRDISQLLAQHDWHLVVKAAGEALEILEQRAI
jgi:hypothetical protein